MTEVSFKSSYFGNATFAAVGRIAPIAIQLGSTPFIIESLGVDSFAVWAIFSTTISLMLTADFGVVGIMQRYHSVAKANNAINFGGRITATVLLFLFALLIIITLLGPFIADGVLAIIKVGPGLHDAAWLVFRNAGTISVMQLIALALTAYLAANNKFIASAVSSVLARTFFVISLIVVLNGDLGLPGLIISSYIDAITAIFIAAIMCWNHLILEVRGLVNRDELRELWAFAWRNQISGLGFIAQRESDVIMAAVLLPATFQATIAASAQLASAVAFAPTITLIPLLTLLSALSTRSHKQVIRKVQIAENNWFKLILPFGALILSIGPFASQAWLGPELPSLMPVMALITAGFLVALANSVRAVFLRSIAMPGVESRTYLWLIISKVLVGVPATLIWGIYGLAASTVIASGVSVAVMWVLTSGQNLDLIRPTITGRTLIWSTVVFVVGLGGAITIWILFDSRLVQMSSYFALGIIVSGFLFWRNKSEYFTKR